MANEKYTINDCLDEVSKVQAVKRTIREAIEGKGVQVPEDTDFASYAEKIEEIEGGSGEGTVIKGAQGVGGTDWEVLDEDPSTWTWEPRTYCYATFENAWTGEGHDIPHLTFLPECTNYGYMCKYFGGNGSTPGFIPELLGNPNYIETANCMFEGSSFMWDSSVIENLTELHLENCTEASYMFKDSTLFDNIGTIYFNSNSEEGTNVYGMFANQNRLQRIESFNISDVSGGDKIFGERFYYVSNPNGEYWIDENNSIIFRSERLTHIGFTSTPGKLDTYNWDLVQVPNLDFESFVSLFQALLNVGFSDDPGANKIWIPSDSILVQNMTEEEGAIIEPLVEQLASKGWDVVVLNPDGSIPE